MSDTTISKRRKSFDFSRFKERHIALRLLYFGWDYDGLAEQANCDNTIEHHLFKALITTCLVESRQKCNYNRCGRTDKGVSSYGQVVNLNVRSNLVDEDDPQNLGLFTPQGYVGDSKGCEKQRKEINYIDTLNRVLPDHIRALAWAPVGEKFSSRFDCQCRCYSYIFPKGHMCVDSIERGLKFLIGEHDFRNLCSYDLKNGVTNHRRTIIEAFVKPLVSDDRSHRDSQYSFYEVIIVGKAFLYHQIRCIMSILFLIGTGKESAELVRDLLDIKKCPSRPNYNRASALPLSLFECQYEASQTPLGWIHSQQEVINVYKHLKHIWLRYKTKATMIEQVLFDLEKNHLDSVEVPSKAKLNDWKDFGLESDTMSDRKYIPVLKRPCDTPLESKLETLQAKRQKQCCDTTEERV